MIHQLLHRPLTSSQVADLLGVDRLTVLRWIKSNPSLEPELSAREGNRIRYRFFEPADVERLREHQRGLHTEKYMKRKES